MASRHWVWVVVCTVVMALTVDSTWAEEVVISDDGKQIQLNGDGTWVQLSKDRFANNAAGQRIRLKPDGTWSLLSADEATTKNGNNKNTGSLTPIAAGYESTLFLARVEILKRRIKRAKSVHAETSTVYHVQVINDGKETVVLSSKLKQALTARSSKGIEYPIVAVEYEQARITPGSRGNIRVITEGAPQWFGVKAMELVIAPNALGNRGSRVLSKSMDDVDKRSVERL